MSKQSFNNAILNYTCISMIMEHVDLFVQLIVIIIYWW